MCITSGVHNVETKFCKDIIDEYLDMLNMI